MQSFGSGGGDTMYNTLRISIDELADNCTVDVTKKNE